MNRSKAILLQALAAILFSSGGLMIKVIDLSPMSIVGARATLTLIILVGYMLYTTKPTFTWSWPQIGAALGIAGAQFFFVLATKQTTAANAIFIQFAAPIYVAFLGIWLLKERLKGIDWLSLVFIFAGLFFFFQGDLSTSGFWGNINALISGISLAFFVICLRMQKDGSTIESIVLGNALCALTCLPFLLAESPKLSDWGGLVFLGIFQMGLPFILLSISIKYLSAIEAIVIQTLEPVFNPIWVFLVIGEKPAPLALLGCSIVFLTVLARSIIASQQKLRRAK
ncbi:MAG: DMT family transporter [Trueperaceae bacterium]|nr:DMT family transporter [Trueperaceae bacterium]